VKRWQPLDERSIANIKNPGQRLRAAGIFSDC